MRGLQNYIRDVIGELRKVTWPTRDELKGSTITVVVFSIVATVFVFLADIVLGWAITSFTKLF